MADPLLHSRIVECFVRLAGVIQAVYSVGTISRGMLIRPDGVYGDRDSRPYDPKLEFGWVWRGVAGHSVYMEWFGPEYVLLLPDDVTVEGTPRQGGLLFNYGPTSQLQRRIPREMLAPQGTTDVAASRPDFRVMPDNEGSRT